MIDQAEELVDRYPGSRAAKRRAVSGAYYGVFHELMQSCASAFLPRDDKDTAEYERIYRSLDHGTTKGIFGSNAIIRSQPELKDIGDLVVGLQSARMSADYAPPHRHALTFSVAKQHIRTARRAVERLRKLSERQRRTLAVCLLFRDRRSQ